MVEKEKRKTGALHFHLYSAGVQGREQFGTFFGWGDWPIIWGINITSVYAIHVCFSQ